MICDAVQALPIRIGRVCLGPLPLPETALCTRVRGERVGDKTWSFDCQVMDGEGRLVIVVEGLQFKEAGALPDHLRWSL